MLTPQSISEPLARPWITVGLFTAAMLLGLLVTVLFPGARSGFDSVVDPVIIALVALLFFDLRFTGALNLFRSAGTLGLLLVINFVIIPLVAFGLTTLVVPENEMLRLGVLIYLLFPCTDWFLGFVRVTGGNTALGAALIPVNLTIQLLLYPVWISVFTGDSLGSVLSELGPALLTGVGIPAAIALVVRACMHLWADSAETVRVRALATSAMPWVLAGMIFLLFAANGAEALIAPGEFGSILLVVFLFFLGTFLLIEGAARVFKLTYEDYSLLTFTASARNAPLMLAVTSLAFGDQPVLLAAIVVGMLLEFPHLTALTWVLRRRLQRMTLAA